MASPRSRREGGWSPDPPDSTARVSPVCFSETGREGEKGAGGKGGETAAAQAGALSMVLKPRPARDRGPLRPAPHASVLSRTTLPSASRLQAADLPEVYAQCGSVTAGRRAGCLPRRAEQQLRAHAGAESLGGKRTEPRGRDFVPLPVDLVLCVSSCTCSPHSRTQAAKDFIKGTQKTNPGILSSFCTRRQPPHVTVSEAPAGAECPSPHAFVATAGPPR